jgi:ribosomal protein S18 acetylase RimI-like enzyme
MWMKLLIMKFSTRKLIPSDAGSYRDLSLAAMLDAPESFNRRYQDEADRPLQFTEIRLKEDPNNFTLGAFSADDGLIGMVGFGRGSHAKLSHKGTLWGMFVSNLYRRQGVGGQLVAELIKHVSSLPDVEQIQLSVPSSNISAIGLYSQSGFNRHATEQGVLKVAGKYQDEYLMILNL